MSRYFQLLHFQKNNIKICSSILQRWSKAAVARQGKLLFERPVSDSNLDSLSSFSESVEAASNWLAHENVSLDLKDTCSMLILLLFYPYNLRVRNNGWFGLLIDGQSLSRLTLHARTSTSSTSMWTSLPRARP